MKQIVLTFTLLILLSGRSEAQAQDTGFYFYGDRIGFTSKPSLPVFSGMISQEAFSNFIARVDSFQFDEIISSLRTFRQNNRPDDWLFYQLIRKTAQFFSPKEENYTRYTLYKWYFLTRTGYDAFLAISEQKVLFYVQSHETIYNIPYRIKNGLQYVCLNYHDYGGYIDFEKEKFMEVPLPSPPATQSFSYKVTQVPSAEDAIMIRDLAFTYNQVQYHFRIRLNGAVNVLFKNYPAVDYGYHFNTPLSAETYSSLIPSLKKYLKGMKPKQGVDFLMQFTRYAFLYKPDMDVFGQDKRFTPEQTLLSEYSDCEDRSALFFYLVKELYNLPMLVLAYPRHVTIAVQFEKPEGRTIEYQGKKYSICEPTPQNTQLHIGQTLPELNKEKFEIVYAYDGKR